MDDNQEEVEKHFNYLMFSFAVYTSGLHTNRTDTFYTFYIIFKDRVFPASALSAWLRFIQRKVSRSGC